MVFLRGKVLVTDQKTIKFNVVLHFYLPVKV